MRSKSKYKMPIIDEPLVPPDADLRDLPGLMLDTRRLLDSDLIETPDAETLRIALKSWAISWNNVPAGTLPDDDVKLARMFGFGCREAGINDWRSMRARAGLYGWVKCSSDGLLYHPILAEKVVEALASKMANAARTAPAREAAVAAKLAARAKKAELRRLRESLRVHSPAPPPPSQPIDIFASPVLSQTNGRVCSPSVSDCVTDAKVREGKVSEEELASLPSDSVAPRAGGTLPLPSGSASVVAAIPVAVPSFQAEPEPEEPAVLTRNKMPRLSDPPSKWVVRELTLETSKDDCGSNHPVVQGYHLDILAQEVCKAAGMDRPSWRGDWWTICKWLHSGFGSDHIINAIAERRRRFGEKWRPPDLLVAFDSCVREYRPSRNAA